MGTQIYQKISFDIKLMISAYTVDSYHYRYDYDYYLDHSAFSFCTRTDGHIKISSEDINMYS